MAGNDDFSRRRLTDCLGVRSYLGPISRIAGNFGDLGGYLFSVIPSFCHFFTEFILSGRNSSQASCLLKFYV